MTPETYRRLDVSDIAELTSPGQVSAGEVLDAALGVIADENPTHNAVVALYEDLGRRQIEAGLPKGSLCGVPVLLKDLSTPWAETRTTFGSELFRDALPWQSDCALVRRLKNAGAVVIGRSNSPRNSGLHYGQSRKPTGQQRIPGHHSDPPAARAAVLQQPLPAV